MAVPEKPRPGPLPAIVGGVIVALVLMWLVGVVVGTVVFFVRTIVFVGLVIGAFWLWSKFSHD